MINKDDNKQLSQVSGNDVPTLSGFQKHETFCLRRDRKPVRMCDLIFNGFFSGIRFTLVLSFKNIKNNEQEAGSCALSS